MLNRILLAVLAALALAAPAQAKLTAQSASGFSLAVEGDVTVSPQQAFDSFVNIGGWWDMAHSYSHDSRKMHIELKPGGTWHEFTPGGGFVTHMEVFQAEPGARLVLTGGLGPLAYMGVHGALTVTFEKVATGTHVKISYAVGGFDADGFKTMSKAVDGVWSAQFARYVAHANSGKP
jgi:uncharacterized protein YndB with AHSA1/START domain